MSTIPLSPQRPDRIFAIALGLVGLFGALQLAAVGLYYGNKARAAYALSHASVTTAKPAATPGATPATAAEASAAPATTTTTTAGASPAATTQTTPSAAALSAADRLLKEATMLRERGDTTNALSRLGEAAQRDPKNASVLAEMAMIYESIQSFDRSNETWRKIQEIGPSAGAFYELADMKLKLGVPAPAGGAAVTAGPGLAGVSPLDTGARDDSEGFADGSTFAISDVSAVENEDPDAETNMTLRVSIKVRPKEIVDHTKVKIQVYFYDLLDNKDIVMTDADVSYDWATPNHDWKTSNPEVLAVTYVRPKTHGLSSDAALTAAAAAVKPGKKPSKKDADAAAKAGHRKYAGYQVRVYYDGQLQAVRADPTKLLNLFPPPLSATTP